MEPTLQNIVDQKSLRWVFVGGKGGVGKTTTSCCLAIQLAKERRNVLIVSTDPAHNLSDAFSQKFTKDPLLVNGYSNLYCMEVDSTSGSMDWDLAESSAAADGVDMDLGGLEGGIGSIMKGLVKSVPGIDEAMAFGELMKMVREMNYEVVVFDTAPTGHTLRLLSFPKTMESAIGKVLELKSRYMGLLTQVTTMMGPEGASGFEATVQKLEELKGLIDMVSRCICVVPLVIDRVVFVGSQSDQGP